MSQLLHLLRWDFVHLQRNQIISISLLVGAVYLGAFYLLRSVGALENLLVVMIFNDPILMSYFFGGVLLLFERNQGTLDTLAVTPLSLWTYLWARGIALSVVATVVSLLMAWVGYGFSLNYLPFLAGTFGTSLLFTWAGGWVANLAQGFNGYLIRSVGFFVAAGLPFLSLFNVWQHPILYLVPSLPGLLLLRASFETLEVWQHVYSYLYLIAAGAIAFRGCYQSLATP